MTPFGEAMRALRSRRGLLACNVARDLGVTTNFLSAVENGRRRIPPDLVARAAKAYRLEGPAKEALQRAADLSSREFRITLKGAAATRERLLFAGLVARRLARIDGTRLRALRDILDPEPVAAMPPGARGGAVGARS